MLGLRWDQALTVRDWRWSSQGARRLLRWAAVRTLTPQGNQLTGPMTGSPPPAAPLNDYQGRRGAIHAGSTVRFPAIAPEKVV
ncbi:hypothetical protein NDU88_006971 [Pleurodeles waltl]|uniref:Uncharacterized protein n=1 Tax=Pleurodeles waltl TaxID=8319 RepID=A0AAV7MLJ2_PLEWA|nr:hypothetical protein NDU88_006971 [Pleurodeles waltl]